MLLLSGIKLFELDSNGGNTQILLHVDWLAYHYSWNNITENNPWMRIFGIVIHNTSRFWFLYRWPLSFYRSYNDERGNILHVAARIYVWDEPHGFLGICALSLRTSIQLFFSVFFFIWTLDLTSAASWCILCLVSLNK